MQPLVSVIIPVYNTEKYLKKCLDSIFNQSLQEIEIIVVNDCSKGNTDEIIDKYLDKNTLSYYKLEKNIGLGAVRNFAIEKAKGKYISFCDSDDWVDLFLYETMAEALERTNAEIAICGTQKEFPSGAKPVSKAYYEKELLLDADTAFRIMTFQYEYGITITPSANSKMIMKSFLETNKIHFAEGVYYEDLFFSFNALLLANKVVCVPHYYHHYLRRDNSIIISISKYHIESFYSVFSKIKNFLVNNNLFEEYRFNYYKFCERFYNLIIRQIFEFGGRDETKKKLLEYSTGLVKKLITMEEFMEYTSAEKLRRHLQPYVESTKII